MSEFAYMFRGRETGVSPERQQQTMQKWYVWFRELSESGHLKDPGRPLQQVGAVIRGSGKTMTDGPYAEAKDVIGGYILVEAADLQEAAELAKGCPILDVGGSVEVRPTQKLDM